MDLFWNIIYLFISCLLLNFNSLQLIWPKAKWASFCNIIWNISHFSITSETTGVFQWSKKKLICLSEIIMCHGGRIGCYDVLLILAIQKLLWSFWMLGCFWYLNQSEIIMGHGGRIGFWNISHFSITSETTGVFQWSKKKLICFDITSNVSTTGNNNFWMAKIWKTS
jgi:hypothetical protein